MSRAKPPGYLPAFCLTVLLPNALPVVLGLPVGGLAAAYGLTYPVSHYGPWRPVGAVPAARAALVGPCLPGHAARYLSTPGTATGPRKLMPWQIDAGDGQPAPPGGSLLLALWPARNNASAYRRVCMAL